MRDIDTIVVHHSDSNYGNVKTIAEWHKEKGINQIGYHFVILRDGTVEHGRPITMVGAHARGHNVGSIGICLIGRLHVGQMTGSQSAALRSLIQKLLLQYPAVTRIVGHRDLMPTECPGFDVAEWWLNNPAS